MLRYCHMIKIKNKLEVKTKLHKMKNIEICLLDELYEFSMDFKTNNMWSWNYKTEKFYNVYSQIFDNYVYLKEKSCS